ncbi:DMT family transporter [Helicobacter sp. 23-1044]
MTRNKLISLGMLYMFLGALFFSFMNSALKILSQNITIHENLFFRGITMSVFVALLLWIRSKKRHKHHHKKGGWGKLLFRAVVGSISLYAMLYNVAHIELGTAIAFAQSAPIWTAIFAFFILRESLKISQIVSVCVGFIGVILISNPQTSNLPPFTIFCGIISATFAALAFISIRSLKGYFDDLEIMLSFGVVASVMGFVAILIAQDSFSALTFKDFFFIVVVGIMGTFGQYYITRAYTFAPAGIVAPIDYSRIVFSAVLGILLGDSLPNIFIFSGIFLIILSGILIALPIILQEFHKGRK